MNATVHEFPDAKSKEVNDMSRAELMYEVSRLREQQSKMIDYCLETRGPSA